ncbi:MAG: HDOD domain-containing protein, partial [Deltaproteobacteria bacterium]
MLSVFRRKKKNAELDKIIAGYELPSFPATAMTVLGKLRDPDVPLDEIADDLELDPGLHVRVLRTVNSVAFGLSRKVSNVAHAVTLLGRNRLESLVLGVAAKGTLDRCLVPGWFDMKGFWLSAARRASIARSIAMKYQPAGQAEAFTAGLLQDMAVPILAATRGAAYQTIYQNWQQGVETDLPELERTKLGTCHAEIGGALAQRWDFPEELIKGIEEHHQGSINNPGILVASWIADR